MQTHSQKYLKRREFTVFAIETETESCLNTLVNLAIHEGGFKVFQEVPTLRRCPTVTHTRQHHASGQFVTKSGQRSKYLKTTPSKASDEQHRKGLEAALIALHRRETNCSPTANFGRIIDGYKQSSYSYNDPAYKGGPLGPGEEEPNTASGVSPPDWQNWQEPIARDWMSFDWSEPYRLEQRLEANPPDTGLYRIWYDEHESRLAYIGESSNIPSRLYNHEDTYGGEALFAYARRTELDAPHKRKEVETDCLGAYYLAVGEAPLSQFGHTDSVPL